jgi:DNA-binding transcriptional ArsR family regulator
MSKLTLDMETFKALASDTRLDILRALDGKKLSLKDISAVTKLNKATLHEHLMKLNQAGLVKRKEREGHKWVVYKLTWKGEGLLHPENTKIVVMFSLSFLALLTGVIQLVWYVRGITGFVDSNDFSFSLKSFTDRTTESNGGSPANADQLHEIMEYASDPAVTIIQNPLFLYLAVCCFVVFTVICCLAIWKLLKNKKPRL